MTTQKTCQKCNAVLEEGAVFCSECGTKNEEKVPEYETVFCPECGEKTTTEFQFCPECGKPLSDEKAEVAAANTVSPVTAVNAVNENGTEKKKIDIQNLIKKPMFIGIAAAAVILVIIIAIFANKGGSSSARIIYAKDKELQYKYLPTMKSFELTDRLFDEMDYIEAYDYRSIYYSILISDNGRYIYYPDRVEGGYVTYYWRDLKADNTKKDPVKIDSEIDGLPVLSSDGNRLFYMRADDNKLYAYDRKSGEKNKLDEDVISFYINDAGNYMIYSKYDDNTIYEMTIKGITGEKTKIDSASSIQNAYPNDKKLYYIKDANLYLKEAGKDKVKIASDISRVVSVVDGSAVYYLKTETVRNKLSDFVNDDMAANDRNLTEPVYPTYPEEPTYPRESDYQEETWVDSYWGNERHPVTDNWGYWNYETNWDDYSAAYEQYEIEYDKWEEEYNRLRDEYNTAYAEYQAKESRDELRRELDNEDNAVTYDKYQLYYYDKNKETLVASDLSDGYNFYLAASSEVPAVIYKKNNTSDAGQQKLSELLADMDDYYYISGIVYDIQSKILASRSISDDVYIALGDKESMIDNDNAERWSIHKNGKVYFIDDYKFDKGYGTLMSADIKNNTLSKPVKMDDDVQMFIFGNENDNVIYFKDVKDYKGDMYINGKQAASDVYVSSLYNYKGTSTFLYYTDYSERNEKGTLCILKDGKETKISDDVSYFSPINEKNIAYLVDYSQDREKGDLMLYKGGKKPVGIDTDVTALLYNPDMVWYSSWYYIY